VGCTRPRLHYRYGMAGSIFGRGGELEVRIGTQEAGRGEECGGYGAGCRGDIGRQRIATTVPIQFHLHVM